MPSAVICVWLLLLLLDSCWASLCFAPASSEAQRVSLQAKSQIFTGLGCETIWVELSGRAYPIVYPRPSTLLLWALPTLLKLLFCRS